MPLTQEEIEYIKSQGQNPNDYEVVGQEDAATAEPQSEDMGVVRAATAPVMAHLGGLTGGGLAALGTMAGLTALTGGGAAPVTIPAMLGIVGAGTLAGAGGGYLGQRGQEALLGKEKQDALEAEAQKAYAQSPVISNVAELATGALIGGGKPSLKNLQYAFGRNLPEELSAEGQQAVRRAAIGNVLTGNAIGAGAQTGLSAAEQLYNTGTIDPMALAKQAALGAGTGAIFTNPNWLGKTINPRWQSVEEHVKALKESADSDMLDDQTDRHDEILADTATAPARILDRRTAELQQLAQQGQATDAQVNELNRIKRAINNANVLLNPKAIPDSVMLKDFKKMIPKVTDSMDNTAKAEAVAEAARLNAMTNEQKRQYMYEQSLKNIDTETAGAVKQYMNTSDEYVDFWKQQKRSQDQDFLNNEKVRVAHLEAHEENIKQLEKQREEAYAAAREEEAAKIKQQMDEAQRQRNLALAEEARRAAEIERNQQLPPASPERVAKTNLTPDAILRNAIARQTNLPEPTMPTGERTIAPRAYGIDEPTRELAEPLEQSGVADTIEALSMQGKTVTQIARSLRVTPEQVNAVRDNRGIPPRENSVEFNRWVEERNAENIQSAPKDKTVATPTGTAGFRGNRMHPDDAAHIGSGKATIGTLLARMANRGTSAYAKVARKLYQMADRGSLNVAVQPEKLNLHDYGYFDMAANKIKLSHTGASEDVLMHEIRHALTTFKLPPELHGKMGYAQKLAIDKILADPKTDKRVKELLETYNEAVDQFGLTSVLYHPGQGLAGEGQILMDTALNLNIKLPSGIRPNANTIEHIAYGMSDPYEFIAHSNSSREFRKTLQALKTKGGKSVWEKIKDIIGKLFGFDPSEQSLFERSEKAMYKIANKESSWSLRNGQVHIQPSPEYRTTAKSVKGADIRRALDVFGASMYDKGLPQTLAKELTQNGIDAIRENIEAGNITEGKIVYGADDDTGTIVFGDTGTGMSPDIALTKFLPAFVTGKNSDRALGGYGLAKIAVLGSPESWEMTTVSKDATTGKNIQTKISGTGEKWKSFTEPEMIEIPALELGQTYNIGGLEVTVTESQKPTGTVMNIKLPKLDPKGSIVHSSYYDYELSKIAEHNLNNEVKFEKVYLHDPPRSNNDVIEGWSTASYQPVRSNPPEQTTETVPGAIVKIHYTPTAKVDNLYRIPVANHGMLQFETRGAGNDVKLPEDMIINIIPTVDVKDGNYPFTTSRDELKGPAKTKVEELIGNLATIAKQKQVDLVTTALSNAPNIAGSRSKFVDMSQNIPKDVVDKIINHPVIRSLNKGIQDMHLMMWKQLNAAGYGKVFNNVEYKGMAVNGEFYGIRVGTLAVGSPGKIYYDPLLTASSVQKLIGGDEYLMPNGDYDLAKAYAHAITGTALHEICHQESHSEGEEHARSMTRMAYVIDEAAVYARRAIESRIKANGGNIAIEQLTDLYNEAQQHSTGSTANTILGAIQRGQGGQPYAAEPTRISGQPRSEMGGSTSKSREIQASPAGRSTETSDRIERELEQSIQSAPRRDLLSRVVDPITSSAIDKVRDISPDGEIVAKGFTRTLNTAKELQGKFWTTVEEAGKGLNDAQLKRLDAVLSSENRDKRSYATMLRSADERAAYKAIRKTLSDIQDHRLAINEPVMRNGVPTKPITDKWYYPTTEEIKMGDIIRQNTDAPMIAKFKQDFQDNYLKHLPATTPTGLDKAWADFVDAHQGSAKSQSLPTQAHFNAMRQQAGIPLPDSLRRMNPMENMANYIRRASMDMSHYENIEDNPEVSARLGYNEDAWGNKINRTGINNIHGNDSVKSVLDQIRGEVTPYSQRAQRASEGLASSIILGPLTEIHKMAAAPFQASVFAANPVEFAKAMFHGATNIGRSYFHAKENGLVVENPQQVKRFFDSNVSVAEKINLVAKGIRGIYTLNGLTEKLQVGLAQGTSEYLVQRKIDAANNGDKIAINTMKQIDPDWTAGKTYSAMEETQLASRMAGFLTGTRDARTMPTWMLHDNEVSSFFKLMSWNVSQTNSFMKNAWAPAMQGNITPLIMTTFGATLGGFIIKELRERASGKESPIPSLADIAASSKGIEGNIPAVAYNWMSAAGYGGLGGLISLAAKYPFDIAYRNLPQGAIFPLDEVTTQYTRTAMNVADALAHDPTANVLQIASRAMSDMIVHNSQLGRVAMNQLINSGVVNENMDKSIPKAARRELEEYAYEKKHSDAMSQLKRFKQVEGVPVNPSTDVQSNPYLNLEQKRFKQTQDVGEAASIMPDIIRKYIQEYASNPDVLLSKIEGLKANPYDVFPSLESSPVVFSKYLRFLQREHGQQAASKMLMDYMTRNTINQVKSSIVPL